MISKIKDILTRGVNEGDFPGANFCYIESDKIYCDFVGYSQVYPHKIKMKENEIFDIASLSKIISTTSIIFNLIQDNKIRLKDKVKKILPEYQHDETTIEDLLLHTSGLAPIIHNNNKVNDKESLINQIFLEPLVYKPRTKIVYSDTGFLLLGFIIEKIEKKSIDLVFEDSIKKALNLKDTSYHPNYNLAVPTEIDENNLLIKGTVHDERSKLLNGLSGHAGLFSTSYDIALFIKSFLNDNILYNKEMKKLIMETNYTKEDLNGDILVRSYGYQKFNSYKKTNDFLITHTGFTGCNMWIDCKNKRGFVLLSNAIHPKRSNNNIFKYRSEILDLFYKETNYTKSSIKSK